VVEEEALCELAGDEEGGGEAVVAGELEGEGDWVKPTFSFMSLSNVTHFIVYSLSIPFYDSLSSDDDEDYDDGRRFQIPFHQIQLLLLYYYNTSTHKYLQGSLSFPSLAQD